MVLYFGAQDTGESSAEIGLCTSLNFKRSQLLLWKQNWYNFLTALNKSPWNTWLYTTFNKKNENLMYINVV